MRRASLHLAFLSILLATLAPAALLAGDTKPAASLVIPYFEADTSGVGKATLFSVTNVGPSPAIAHVVLWTSYWQPTIAFDVVLASQDIATYNVRDILNGTFPATAPLDLPGCAQSASPVFGDAERTRAWQDHRGETCLGKSTAPHATGFITIDVVDQCTPMSTAAYGSSAAMTPLSAGYFGNAGAGLAANSNVLVGDFHLVDTAENYAQGDIAIHLRADAQANPPGSRTFYSPLGSGGVDNRQPLPSTLFGRFLNGGAFSGGTAMVLLRAPNRLIAWQDLECGVAPWTEAESEMNVAVLDEQAGASLSQRSMPYGNERVDLRTWGELPVSGALELEFADQSQIGGVIIHNAADRFSSGFPMQNLRDDGEGSSVIDGLADGLNADFEFSVDGYAASFSGFCTQQGQPVACTPVAWYFGDSTGGGAIFEATHIYALDGTFPVTFVARNEAGQQAAGTHYVTIAGDGGGGGGGDFSVAISAVQIPGTLSVLFAGSCFADGAAVACENPAWSFGDGTTGSIVDLTHAYGAAGTYNVSFTAQFEGVSDTATTSVTVQAVVPGDTFDVFFTALQIPGTLNVQFAGTCFANGAAVACGNPQWSFGDGGTSAGVAPLHAYSVAGSYPVSFTASFGGVSDTAARTILVQAVAPPPGDFSVSFSSIQVPATLQMQFTGACFEDGLAVTCENPQWAFGDGTNGAGVTPSHLYGAAGSYQVTFTASRGDQTDSQTLTIIVQAVDDGGEFTVTGAGVQVPGTLNVQFTGACFEDGVAVACGSPSWNFGDGGSATTVSPLHTFPAPGTFDVTFTASSGGETDSHTFSLTVQDPDPGGDLSVSFTATQVPGTLEIQFAGACFENLIAVACGSPAWTFGDGGTSAVLNPSHTYPVAGDYEVTFQASHGGDTATETRTITVAAVPASEFAVTFTYVQVPGTLRVDFDASCFLDEVPVACASVQWTFGDGGVGNLPEISHTYAAPGSYQVTLTASSGGQSDSHTATVVVAPGNNVPTISSLICTPNPVIGGLISLCVLAIVDLDDDELTWQVDLLGGLGVCLDDGFHCTTSITGHVDGGLAIQIPFSIATNLTQATTATIRAIVTDEHGSVSNALTATIDVILNTPPVISVFACVPPIMVRGTSGLCSFNLVDLDPGNLSWKVEIVGGTNACLGNAPGCAQILQGTTNGLLSTQLFGLRTALNTSGPIKLRATANDGLQEHVVQIEIPIL